MKHHLLTNKGLKLKLVDTPGFADTYGKVHDLRHFDEIAKYINKNKSFTAIGFILKNSTTRST